MKHGWEIKKLGEVCEIKTGKKDVNQGNPNGNYPFFTCAREHTFSDTFSFDTEALLIAGNGDVGNVSYYKGKFEAYQRTYVLFGFKGILPSFLYRVLDGTLKQVMAQSKLGNTMPYIKLGMLKEFEIPLPPLPEQQRIVSILDEAFAAIAKAKANAEQNLKNAKELFESYLQGVFEKKGDGWEQLSVKECVENDIIYKPLDGNHGEIHPTKNDFVSSGVPFIMSRDMKNGGIDEIGCNFITEKQAKTLRTGFAKNGDVLLSHKGTIGGVSILKTEREFIVLTPQITYYRIKDNKKLTKEFLFYYFLNQNFQKEINSIAQGGSTRAYIGITKQLELNLVIAPLEEQQTIVRQLDALRTETQKLEAVYQKKIDDLEELKKSILQKAFAGELKEAKQKVAA